MQRIVLRVELNGLVERDAVGGSFEMLRDTHPVLEAYGGALVDAKKVACVVGEAASAKVSCETMCEREVTFPTRQPGRRG